MSLAKQCHRPRAQRGNRDARPAGVAQTGRPNLNLLLPLNCNQSTARAGGRVPAAFGGTNR